MHLLKTLILSCVLAVAMVVTATAQTRSIYTGGTSTGGGMVHITIEDFGKPGRHDPIGPLGSRPAALFDIFVTVMPGWTCAQTTTAMYNEMLLALPPIFILQISPIDPCLIYVYRPNPSGNNGWYIDITVNVPGQTIVVVESPLPVLPTPWSYIKSLGWNRFRS